MHYQSYVSFIAITFLVPTDAQVPEDGPPVECRPGSHMNNVSGRCVYCVAGRDFTDAHNRLDSCSPCATCTGGRLIKSECTISRNTICVCPDDHYEHVDGCSPRQGGAANDVIAELQVHISDAIKNFSLSVEQAFTRSSAQLRAHSDETRNLSLIADVTSHWILGLKEDLIAGSQSQKNDHVAIIVLVSVVIVLQVITTAVIILKNRRHIRDDSGSGLQPQHQTRLGERASSMYRSLCVCIRRTSATGKGETATHGPLGNPPPGQSVSKTNLPTGLLQISPRSPTDLNASTSKAGAGVRNKFEDAARDAHVDREPDVAAGPCGNAARDNQVSRAASPIVDGGPEEAELLLAPTRRIKGESPPLSNGL